MIFEYLQNRRNFMATTHGEYGRRVIYTSAKEITSDNIVQELANALPDYQFNAAAIMYLDRYYRGDQPILYRQKTIRPEVNNRVVENHAFELVESKVADLYGEPVQYVLDGANDERKGEQIARLNRMMKSEDKAQVDIARGRWASICGTSYLYVGNTDRRPQEWDEAPFFLRCEHPAYTFVVYYADDETEAFSCQVRNNENGTYFIVYTSTDRFEIQNGTITQEAPNGNGMIPVIEYPNNERRLSDIEITITMTDELNKMQSDRMNGIEQFVQALMKFKNCEIDENTFLKMVNLGAVSIKTTTAGYDADVDMMTAELNQDQTQLAKDDVYQNFLIVQGKPGRQENSGGDTGQAVALRNGYYDEDKRAELRIPIFCKSERMMLRVVLNKMRVASEGDFDLLVSDIEIRPKRSKLENMVAKAQVLQILHQIGIDDAIAIKTINLFPDAQATISASADRMEEQFRAANGLLENASGVDSAAMPEIASVTDFKSGNAVEGLV